MSQQRIPALVLSLVLVGASVALAASGAMSLATDAKAPPARSGQEPVSIPAVPAARAVPPIGTDAFTRPMFNSERAQGSDKAPPTPTEASDPSTTASAAAEPEGTEDIASLVLKGIIVSERGARAALLSPGSGKLTWVTAGYTFGAWKVDYITATTVRFRNGDEVAEIKIRKDR